ncbi:Tripeptidyl peptidase A [Mycena venus]|uniref:Tripeptidyl peptidase A n=1 Tax=Mycena venus TaxID=2733690 RepID=A0A8H6YMY2_9AGAR|nr:Tripeptidyl peptidase A [Mycena venus]
MWIRSLLPFLPLAISAFSLQAKHWEHIVKEAVVPPRGWTIYAPAPSDHLIKLRIALPQSNFGVLEDHLRAISNPYHERYGAHLTKEEIEELVAPRPESVAAVTGWLSSHGIQENDIGRSPAGDWLTIRVSVSLRFGSQKYHVWKHSGGDYIVRTTSYSLPKELLEDVELIQPTTMFGTFKKLKSSIHSASEAGTQIQSQNQPPIVNPVTGVRVDASCNTTITISCLKQIYNAVGYSPSDRVGNSIAISGYLDDYANRADLQTFYEEQVPAAAAVNSTFKFVSVAGGLDPQNSSLAGLESSLDTQFAFGLTFPVASTYYSTASLAGSPPFTPDATAPTDTNEPYSDVSASHEVEFRPEGLRWICSIGCEYLDVVRPVNENKNDSLFEGARGVSLTVASGDGGVGDGFLNITSSVCLSNDGLNRARRCLLHIMRALIVFADDIRTRSWYFGFYLCTCTTKFDPDFPASCPYVTAVGGTTSLPEKGVFFSGGGFSNYFPRPSYQDVAVGRFLSKLPNGTYSGMFNPSGRAIPDVSTQSFNFRAFVGGQAMLINGTSASSPTFAGFVALLNDARLKKGLPSLGFLNPLLYSTAASGFNDITVGNNPGCGTPGFNAAEGWDAGKHA